MRVFYHVLFLMVSFQAYAQNYHAPSVCSPNEKPTDWWAGRPKDVESAPCKRTTPFSLSEMKDWISANSNAKEMRETFNELTASENSKKNPKSKCTEVICKAQEKFGQKVGIQLLFMRLRFGFNGSHLSEPNSSAMTSAELDEVLLASSDLPETLTPIDEGRPLVHFSRGFMRAKDSERVVADSGIILYDAWNGISKNERRQAIVHEMAHVISEKSKDLAMTPEWLKISGWGQTKGKWKAKLPGRIPSIYGLDTPDEDFAESVVAYRYRPNELLRRSPEKYKILKEKIFDGLEYRDQNTCQVKNSDSFKLAQKLKAQVKNYQFTEKRLKSAVSACGPTALAALSLMSSPFDVRKNGKTKKCIRSFVLKDLSGGKAKELTSRDIVVSDELLSQAASYLQKKFSLAFQAALPVVFEYEQKNCIEQAEYVYQAVESQNPHFAKTFDSSDPLLTYNHQGAMEKVFRSVCYELKRDRKTSEKIKRAFFSEERIRVEALKKVMPY